VVVAAVAALCRPLAAGAAAAGAARQQQQQEIEEVEEEEEEEEQNQHQQQQQAVLTAGLPALMQVGTLPLLGHVGRHRDCHSMLKAAVQHSYNTTQPLSRP